MLLPATDPTCISHARSQAKTTAGNLGLGDEERERAAIIGTELTSNIVKHVGRGEVVVQDFDDADGIGVEIIALDSGRGMVNIEQSMQDGYSTAGSAGTGLGAVSRLSDVFAIYTRPGKGTVAVARIRSRRAVPATGFVACSLAVPMSGERVCGDAVAFVTQPTVASVLVVDGLGHGALAAAAAERAVEVFCRDGAITPERVVEHMHQALRPTRGAAAAIARVDVDAGVIDYCGVGNIVGALIKRGVARRMVSYDGTVGLVASRIRSFAYPFEVPPLVVLHSDGLRGRWDLGEYPGLSESHPAVVAGVLFRDFRRDRDDASIVTLKWRAH